MKRIALLFFIAVISGCSALKPTARSITPYFADYRPYAAESFLISPNPYTEEFESIGEIEIVITPALKQYPEEGSAYDARGRYIDYEDISHDELLKIAVEEAKSRGADAIVNFSISKTPISASDTAGSYAAGEEYRIKGFCIKRK